MAPLVISRAGDNAPVFGGLFEGIAFFLTQRVPQRTSYVKKIEDNGGRVVKLEAQANHIIADHIRKDCPPGSISYTFIDVALRDGELPETSDHTAGPPVGAIRDVGSVVPGKQTRTPFTAEDDRVLWLWVERAKQAGGLIKGNDIYKQLEARNPRHTFQAWRDRYIKRLMDKPPAGIELTAVADVPASPPQVTERSVGEVKAAAVVGKQKVPAIPKASKIERAQSPIRIQSTGPSFKLPQSSQAAARLMSKAGSPKLGRQSRTVELLDDDDVSDEVESRGFSDSDFQTLLDQARDIVAIDATQFPDAWIAYATAFPEHTADEWVTFWEEKVRPEYEELWAAFEVEFPDYTDEAWKLFREERVSLAEQRKQKGRRHARRGREDDEDRQNKAAVEATQRRIAKSNRRLREDEEAERMAENAVKDEPRSQQKRKRDAPGVRGHTTYSQKKHKSDVSDLFTDEFEDPEQPIVERMQELRSRYARRPAVPLAVPSTQPVVISDDDDDEVVAAQNNTMQESQVGKVSTEPEHHAEVELDELKPTGLVPDAEQTLPPEPLTSKPMLKADLQLLVELRNTDSGHTSSQEQTSNLPTSDANRAADQQLRRESVDDGDEDVEDEDQQPDSNLPTSDANFAAELQIRRESVDDGDDDIDMDVEQSGLNIVDAETNGVAEQQLREESPVDESAEVQGDIDPSQPTSQLGLPLVEDQESLFVSNHEIDDEEVEDGLVEEELTFPDQGADALTEANLASQQEQHRGQLLRGADLPVDDEMRDQSGFLDYLQVLVGKNAAVKAASVIEQTIAQPAAESSLSESPVAAAASAKAEEADEVGQMQYIRDKTQPHRRSDEEHVPALPGLPLSSQQEVDDILETNLQWPNSPPLDTRRELAIAQPETQNVQFETQVAYPTLVPQDAEEDVKINGGYLHDDNDIAASGPMDFERAIASYEPRPRLIDENVDEESDEGDETPQDHAWGEAEFSSYVPSQLEIPATFTSRPESVDKEAAASDHGLPIHVESDEEDDEYIQENDQIDLTVAEPDGGFGFSSSPARSQASQPLHSTVPTVILDVSSAVSSSSPYQSSSPPSPPPEEEERKGRRGLNTQDILDAETQPLDLDMPLPPDTDSEEEEEEGLPSDPLVAPSPPPKPAKASVPALARSRAEPPPLQQAPPTTPPPQQPRTRPSRPEVPQAQPSQSINLAETQTLTEDNDIDAYISALAARHNCADMDMDIIEALECTSMRPELAEMVLVEVKAGRGVPDDVAGCWTTEEDAVIEGGNARAMRGVVGKHGWVEVENRLGFLEKWRNC